MRAPKIISDFMLKPTPLEEYPRKIVFEYIEDRGFLARISYNSDLKAFNLIRLLNFFPIFMDRFYIYETNSRS